MTVRGTCSSDSASLSKDNPRDKLPLPLPLLLPLLLLLLLPLLLLLLLPERFSFQGFRRAARRMRAGTARVANVVRAGVAVVRTSARAGVDLRVGSRFPPSSLCLFWNLRIAEPCEATTQTNASGRTTSRTPARAHTGALPPALRPLHRPVTSACGGEPGASL
ncbi:hypothetical protein [Polyangium jinanense]|uniref:Uncharacterized protein n=1 Tax=Polyangium jinanense TaxID=2829994 RepID=A0A9X3X5B3_9BACT|nr:hypothetical protein [Polyangium jinanense]MDC3959972.1 hypothetical protein [Polyangium jinanense]MDC3983852.1 hypothetical protein [Polyangium jinanense]